MSPIVLNGKATRSTSLKPPLDCQNVSRFQAKHPQSIVSRHEDHPWMWVFVIGLVAVCIICGALISMVAR